MRLLELSFYLRRRCCLCKAALADGVSWQGKAVRMCLYVAAHSVAKYKTLTISTNCRLTMYWSAVIAAMKGTILFRSI